MMPMAGIFFAGVLWKRTTKQGVVACLVTACIVCPLLIDGERSVAFSAVHGGCALAAVAPCSLLSLCDLHGHAVIDVGHA